jgi:hypothetical protein
MNNVYRSFKRGLLGAVLASTVCVMPAMAQFGDAGAILRSGASDANLIMSEYMRPAMEGFGTGLNTGWFTTAKTHGILGFDLTFRANAAIVPSNLKTFDLSNLALQNTRPANVNNTMASTLMGPKTSVPVEIYDRNNPAFTLGTFNIPKGVNFDYVPSVMGQLSIGLIKNTDITIRYMPTFEIPNVETEISMYGFGFKHDIKQWIPGLKLIPIDISIAAGYTTLTAESPTDVQPSNMTRPGASPASQWEDQKLSFSATGTNVNVLVGKTLPFISAYVGLGYETASTTFKAEGNYPVDSVNNLGQPIVEAVANPLNMDFTSPNGVRALVGARLKLMLFTFSADYVMADMPVASFGFGISFR